MLSVCGAHTEGGDLVLYRETLYLQFLNYKCVCASETGHLKDSCISVRLRGLKIFLRHFVNNFKCSHCLDLQAYSRVPTVSSKTNKAPIGIRKVR